MHVITFENVNTTAQEMATEVLKNSINILSTRYINQGALINVMVSRDVNIYRVYEVITPYALIMHQTSYNQLVLSFI